MDTNIPIESMETLLKLCLKHKRPIFFEPTDLKFAGKPFKLPAELHSAIRYISPNIQEMQTIVTQLGLVEPGRFDALDLSTFTETEILEHTKELATMMTTKVEKCIVTLGSLGVLIATGSTGTHHLYLTTPVKELVNVSGAGDSFVSGFITALLKGYPEEVCVAMGFKAANRALLSKSAVPAKYFDSFDEVASQCDRKNH
jgi:pseudouridylate synthase / pseudouridine kinase